MPTSTATGAPEAAGDLGVASALAPPRFTRRILAAGLLAVVAIGALDIASGSQVLLVAALVLPPLCVALAGGRGDTAAVAVAAGVVAALSLIWNGSKPAGDTVVPVLVVIGGGFAAVAVALVRTSAAIALERFGLLYGVAAVADEEEGTPETLVEGLLDLLVPRLGDIVSIDAILGGEARRLGVRCSDQVPADVAAAVARRRTLPDDDPRSTRRAAVLDRGVMVEGRDLDDDMLSALAGQPGDERLLAQLEIGSGMNLPLRARGQTFGTLSFGMGPTRRRYSDADLAFGEVLAGRVALVLDNAGLTRELSAAEEQLGAVLGTLAEAVTVMDSAGQTVYANDAAVSLLRVGSVEELLSAAPGELMSRFAVFDEAGRRVELRELPSARVLAGEGEVEPMLVRNVVVATGEDRWLVSKVTSLRDADGRLMRVVNVIEDVTEAKRTERAQRLLADVSEALASTLDYEEALQRVAGAAVPVLADWAVIDLVGRRGRLESVAVAHVDPARVQWARRLRERYPVSLDDSEQLTAVIRDGESQLIREVPDEVLAAAARDEEHLHVLREVGMSSVVMAPIVAGAETLGALTFVSADPLRPLGEVELELAEELGRRAGMALLTARQYNRRTAIAQALQHGLLPPDLPDVAGWSSAVLYRPAGELNEVGGDFYDVFAGPDGWMLVIGDVAGQGAEAAARTSLARFTLRTAAELTGDPARALVALNDALRGQPGLPLCTAICAGLAPMAGGGARLRLSVAGHPPPLLVRGHDVIPLGDPGTIAGAFDGETWRVADVDLVPGDVLVLYTDGVLDAVGESDRFGEERLHDALRVLEGSVQERLSGLNEVLRDFQRGPQSDDTTVLVLEYRGNGGSGAVEGFAAREQGASR